MSRAEPPESVSSAEMRVDIPADLNSEDEIGFVWTFLDEADDPSVIRPGEVVIAGSPLTPAVCEVVDIVDKPAGSIVHLRVPPGAIERHFDRSDD